MLFRSDNKITKVTLPNTITDINSCSFIMCVALKSINIPASVTRLWDSSFSKCTSLTSIRIPDSVTRLDGAFNGCTSLKSIRIPNSVITINDDAIPETTTIYCEQGSAAETYAKTNGNPIVYTDISKTTLDSKADKTELNSKADKTTISTETEATASITLTDNSEVRCSELESLTITVPESLSDIFTSSVVFDSGESATELTTDGDVYYQGTDCKFGSFMPTANNHYNMIFSYDGSILNCYIAAISTAAESGVNMIVDDAEFSEQPVYDDMLFEPVFDESGAVESAEESVESGAETIESGAVESASDEVIS